MKKLINRPASLVREMLEGFVASTPGVELAADADVVVRSDLPSREIRKVAVISGGGSGHEPAHAGYVGQGMLTAAVAGEVFTSPDVDSILGAILTVAGPAGALLIVKNYTGDRLNFGLAASLARERGIPTEVVIVADDVSLRGIVPDEQRRGIAGTVFVHKVAGAAAERGENLASVADIARRAAVNVYSMGVALGSCIVPATGKASFELAGDEVEFGLGIHGEKGVRRAPVSGADAIVATLLDSILAESGDQQSCALLINGLGGTPAMELQVVARASVIDLEKRGVSIDRVLVGNFMTAIEMPGVSLSLLRASDNMVELLDDKTLAPAWPNCGAAPVSRPGGPSILMRSVPDRADGQADPHLKAIVAKVAETIIEAEDELSDLDAKAGDGDLGTNLSRGALALLQMPDDAYTSPRVLLTSMADTLRRSIGGSSGPFYAVALLEAARALGSNTSLSAAAYAEALDAAVLAISELGGAQPGERTMLDALHPAALAFRQTLAEHADGKNALAQAAEAARNGAQQTADMIPLKGRASYLGQKPLGLVDGGAIAVAIWLESLANNVDDT